MSKNSRKPSGPFDPITPTHLEPEDEKLLCDIRIAALSGQETSEMRVVNTSGTMRALPPHTLYTISSENSGIFGETVNAICKHLREQRWNIPRAIIQPIPLYEKLEWDMLTPKPFNGIFLFIIAGMQRSIPIPVYRDTQITLPSNAILCLLS